MVKQNFFYRSQNMLFVILAIISLVSCQKTDTPEKDIITKKIDLTYFNKIIVYHDITVEIVQDTTYKALIIANNDKCNHTTLTVTDSCLTLKTKSNNIFSTDLKPILIKIYTPTLNQIRHSGNGIVYSKDTITFNPISLLSESHNSNYSNLGNFDLKINNEQTTVVSNGLSNIKLTGKTKVLALGYYSGVGKFEGATFRANHIKVLHRGENTLKVHPIQSIEGDIYGLGDIECYHKPDIIKVKKHYKGRLLFNTRLN